MDIASVAIAAIALAVAIWSYLGSRRSADRANKAAERSAEAAEGQLHLAKAVAERYAPPWVLAHNGGDTYLLMNESDETALDAEITAPDVNLLADFPARRDIGPRDAVSFLAAQSYATEDDTIEVTWHRPNRAERLTWRRPLPPKSS